MTRSEWRRVVGAGAVWTLIYNLAWGIAWYGFMRGQWETAAAAIHRTMPWSVVWHFWVLVTIPLGMAIMAYARGRMPRTYMAAVAGSVAIGLIMHVGMAVHGLGQSLSWSWRVILLDAAVDLGALVAAALAGAWSLADS